MSTHEKEVFFEGLSLLPNISTLDKKINRFHTIQSGLSIQIYIIEENNNNRVNRIN